MKTLGTVSLRQIKDPQLKALTKSIVEAGKRVWQQLGAGHSEAIYQKAMELETRELGCRALQIVPVIYQGVTVGHHVPDLICGQPPRAVVELKVAQSITKAHLAQLGAYMRLLGLEVGVLLNFPNSLDDPFACELLQHKPVLIV